MPWCPALRTVGRPAEVVEHPGRTSTDPANTGATAMVEIIPPAPRPAQARNENARDNPAAVALEAYQEAYELWRRKPCPGTARLRILALMDLADARCGP